MRRFAGRRRTGSLPFCGLEKFRRTVRLLLERRERDQHAPVSVRTAPIAEGRVEHVRRILVADVFDWIFHGDSLRSHYIYAP